MIITKDNLDILNDKNIILGKKARYLLELYKISKGVIFDIPDFAIIPGNVLEEYNRKHQLTPKNTEQDAINFMRPNQKIVENYNLFVSDNYSELSTAFDITYSNFNPRIRTSICLDENHPDSFAGVNHTIDCEENDKRKFLYYAIPQAIAGLYKPYSNWYLSNKNLEKENRYASLMFSKFVANTYAGIAHISSHHADVVLGLNNITKSRNFSFNFTSSCNDIHEHKKLFNALKFIRNKMNEKEVEVEFLLKNDDSSQLNIMQIRGVQNNDSLLMSRELDEFLCNRQLINLLNKPNTSNELMKNLENIKNPSDFVFIINHENRKNIKFLDATSLIIELNKRYPNSPLFIIASFNDQPPSTHLMTAIREEKLINFKMLPETKSRLLLRHDLKLPMMRKLRENNERTI